MMEEEGKVEIKMKLGGFEVAWLAFFVEFSCTLEDGMGW